MPMRNTTRNTGGIRNTRRPGRQSGRRFRNARRWRRSAWSREMRSPNRTVHLGVSGFGRLAQNYYVPALGRMSADATVVAVADPSSACRDAATRLIPGVQVFESQARMLGDDALRID